MVHNHDFKALWKVKSKEFAVKKNEKNAAYDTLISNNYHETVHELMREDVKGKIIITNCKKELKKTWDSAWSNVGITLVKCTNPPLVFFDDMSILEDQEDVLLRRSLVIK